MACLKRSHLEGLSLLKGLRKLHSLEIMDCPLHSKSVVTNAARELSGSGEYEDLKSTCSLKASTCAGRVKNLHTMHPFCGFAENCSY